MICVGDLVKLKHKASIGIHEISGKLGTVVSLSLPSPIMPYQVASVIFDSTVYEGIPINMLEAVE